MKARVDQRPTQSGKERLEPCEEGLTRGIKTAAARPSAKVSAQNQPEQKSNRPAK